LSTIKIADATLEIFFFSSQIVKLPTWYRNHFWNGHHNIKSR
jgi:hypothetical protein